MPKQNAQHEPRPPNGKRSGVRTILAVGPHPDDAELGIGGTILTLGAAGHTVYLLDMTNGEPTPKGDPDTRAAESARAADILGVAIANVVTLLALSDVFLGGGITEVFGQPFVDRIRAAFDEAVFPERCRACRFHVTALHAEAGLIGAARLARDAVAGDAC